MGTKLEQLAIVQRTNLTNPNYYNLDWKLNNTTNTYSLTHTRALSDNTTPVYGKGTGIFLDTVNGGGSLDINGNPANGGLGRLSSFQLNTANWSYGPATPYSVTNTRALSDNTTPVYGKGTGKFLDPDNGGGSLDINGNPVNGGLGRLGSLLLNVFNKSLPYDVAHTRAISDIKTPENGKGNLNSTLLTSTNDYTLDAHFDINGGSKTDRKGGGIAPKESGRENLLSVKQNYYFPDLTSITNFKTNKTDWYTLAHKYAKADNDEKGKGTGDINDLKKNNDYTLDAHFNIDGGNLTDRGDNILKSDSGRKNLLNAKNNTYFPDLTTIKNFKDDTTANVYSINHPNASAGNGEKGKGTKDTTLLDKNNEFVLPAHTTYSGGSSDDITQRNSNITNPNNYYYVNVKKPDDKTNWYTIDNYRALSDLFISPDNGKATRDNTSLDKSNEFVLPAHTNYVGGSMKDIAQRASLTVLSKDNIYNYSTNIYNVFNPNALAGNDEKGKGTKNSNDLDVNNQFTLYAHININGGNLTDRGENTSKPTSGRKNLLNAKNNKYYPSSNTPTDFLDESKGNWYKKPTIDAQGGTFSI